MSRTICFIDKEGFAGTCSEEAEGKQIIDCKNCEFYKKFKGREKKEFTYCFWLGYIDENENKNRKRT